MALARARVAAKRTKDRWKAKQWYKVTAPPAFNSAVLAETLADEPDKLQNRIVETTLQELTGDMKQMHIKLLFQVKEVVDLNAKTTYIGHTMTSDYTRRLTRRGNSKIPAVYDLVTNDGCRIRVKPFAVTDRRCQTTQEQEMRRAMGVILNETAQKTNLAGLLQQILVGDLTDRLYKACRKVHPVRRVEIGKSEILTAPSIEMDETPIIRMSSPDEETPSEETPAEGAPAEGASAEGAAETDAAEGEAKAPAVAAPDAE